MDSYGAVCAGVRSLEKKGLFVDTVVMWGLADTTAVTHGTRSHVTISSLSEDPAVDGYKCSKYSIAQINTNNMSSHQKSPRLAILD